MSTFNEATQAIAESITEHGPELKIGFGIISGVLALGFAIYGSVKATKEFEQKQPQTKKEKAIIIAKDIGPALVAEAASIVLIAKGVKGLEDQKNEATEALAAAITTAALAKESLKLKEDAIKEVTDEETQQKINSAMAKKRFEQNPPMADNEIAMTGYPQQIYYEPHTRTWFWSSQEQIAKAFKNINYKYKSQGCLSLNEYLWELNLPEVSYGKQVGWIFDIDGELDLDPTPQFTPDGRTATSLEGTDPPDCGYADYVRRHRIFT